MKRTLLAIALFLASTCVAAAQSACPTIVNGAVLTAAQWNACFQAKQDTLGFIPLNRAGGVMTGPLITTGAVAGGSGFRLTTGSAPSSPIDGDVWVTTAGMFVRINGGTVGPLSGGSGSSFSATAPLALSFPAGVVNYAIAYSANFTNNGSNQLALASIASGHLIANSTAGSAEPTDTTVSALLDRVFTSTPNSVIFRGGSLWQSAVALPIASGGSGVATAPLARSAFNIDGATSTGDANYTILVTDRLVYHTALSTARTDTLPAANAVNAGQTLYVVDVRGVASGSNTVTLQRAGSDTVNGGTTATALSAAFGASVCFSDGSSRWTCEPFGGGGGGGVSSVTIAAGTGISLAGTCTITTTGTCTVAVNTAASLTWTGTETFSSVVALNGTTTAGGPVYMGGGGRPWVDVRSGANGCNPYTGSNVGNDTVAIQCQIDYLHTNFGGGFVVFPVGTYTINNSLSVTCGVTLAGFGMNGATQINTGGSDFVAISLTGGGNCFNGLRDIYIACSNSNVAGQSCVFVNDNTNSIIENVNIQGGYRALDTHGVDGRYRHVVAAASAETTGSANLFSRGSNFYADCKFDSVVHTDFGGFIALPYDPTSTAPMENQFVNTDFTGPFGAVKGGGAAFAVDDGGNVQRVAVTKCFGCIFGAQAWGSPPVASPAVIINNAIWTLMDGAEVGNTITFAATGGTMTLSASWAPSPVLVSGAGTDRICPGLKNITC